ncbi:MAG: NfeD family protein [Gammaproteobacteria bacterium]
MELVLQLLPWHWLAAGLGLIILEMLIPTGHTIWLGISALVVGAILWLIPGIDWKLQMLIFAVLSFVSFLIYKRIAGNNPVETDSPDLNRRGERYIGRTFTIEEPIVNGVGKIRVDDSIWRVNGDDQPVGTKVKVVAMNGSTLQVETL